MRSDSLLISTHWKHSQLPVGTKWEFSSILKELCRNSSVKTSSTFLKSFFFNKIALLVSFSEITHLSDTRAILKMNSTWNCKVGVRGSISCKQQVLPMQRKMTEQIKKNRNFFVHIKCNYYNYLLILVWFLFSEDW